MLDIDVWNPPSSSESPHSRNRVWTSVPNFNRGRSPASQPKKVASRLSKRARIFSAASFLSTGHHQPVVLQPGEDCPNTPMVYGDSISECEPIRREVFFYPRESSGRDGAKQEDGRVVLTEKINRWRTTRSYK